MSLPIEIDDIDALPFPIYVLVAGGIGAGKTRVVHENIHDIKVFDLDDVMEELGYTQYKPECTSVAMGLIAERIKKHMDTKQSMVAMGTAANLGFSIDRLHWAKMMGYQTVLLHIDATAQQSIKQNAQRRSQGQRAVSPSEEYRIPRTTRDAANTVATLRDTVLVDYFCYYRNTPDHDS